MTKKKTPEQFYTQCLEKDLDLPIEPYVDAVTKIKFKCSKNHVYKQLPNNHLKGQQCPKCRHRHIWHTMKEVNDYLSSKGYDLCVDKIYKGTQQKYTFYCPIHGNYKQRMSVHLSGTKCRYCGAQDTVKNRSKGYNKMRQDTYIKYCKDRGLDLPIEPRVDSVTPIKYQCNTCGFIYTERPDNHYNSRGCPKCNPRPRSIGEQLVSKVLDDMNINYKTNVYLIKGTKLSYDFYLPDYNTLIEYQGIQHYEPRFGKEDYFYNKQVLNDTDKRNYAAINNYNLIEIPYTYDTYSTIKSLVVRKLY